MANISSEEMEELDLSMDMEMSPSRGGPSSRYCPPGTSYGSPVASTSTYPEPTRRYEHLDLMNNLAKMQRLKRIRRQLELNRTPPPMNSPPTSPRRSPQGAAPCPVSPPPSPFRSPHEPWSPRTPPPRTPGSPRTPRTPRTPCTPRTPQSPHIHGREASSPVRPPPFGWSVLFAEDVELPDDLLDPVDFYPQQEEPLDLLQENIPAELPQALIAAPLRRGFFNVLLHTEPSAEPALNLTNELMEFDSIDEEELEKIIKEEAAQALIDPYFPEEPCEGQAEYEVEKNWLEYEENEPLNMSASFTEAPSYISVPSTKDSTIPSFLHSTYSSMGSDAELFVEDGGKPGTFAMPGISKIKDPGARFQRLKFLKDMHFRDMTEESFGSSIDEDFFVPPITKVPERRHSLYDDQRPRDSIRNQARRGSAPPGLFEDQPRPPPTVCPGDIGNELMDWDVSGASSVVSGEPGTSELFEEVEPGTFAMPYISMIQDPGARFQRLKLLKDMHREKSMRKDRCFPPMGRVPERRHSMDRPSARINQVRRGSAPPDLLDNQGPIKMLFPRRHSLNNEQRPRESIRNRVRRGSAPAGFINKWQPLPAIVDRRHSFYNEQRPRDSIRNQVRRGSAPPDLFDRLPPPPPLICPGDIGDEFIEWDASGLMPDEPFETTPREHLSGVIEPEDVYSPDEEIAFRAAARRFIEIKHNPQMYYDSFRPAMPPMPTDHSSAISDLEGAECLDMTGSSFSSTGSRLFVEDENEPGTYTMPGISNVQDPARRFEKLKHLRNKHFGDLSKEPAEDAFANRIPDRRESYGGWNQTREIFPGRLSGPPGMLEVLPSAPPLIRPGNILNESIDFGDVSETSALPSEPDEPDLLGESFELDESIPEPVVHEFPEIVEPEDAYSPAEEQAIRDAHRRFLEVKYNPQMYYPSQAFAHIPERDRLLDESLPAESFEDWETMGAPGGAVLDDDEMALVNAIPATPTRGTRRLSRGMSPTRSSQERRLSGPPVFNLEMERRPVPDRIPERAVGRVFDVPDHLEGQPCPDGLTDEALDLIFDDSDLSGLENITRAPALQGRYSFGLTPTKQRHRRRLSGPPDFNLERGAREPLGLIDTSMPEHDYSGVSDFMPPTTAQWAEELFRTVGKPGRRASYGGDQTNVCSARRLSAPPETIGKLDLFELDPRRPVTRPRHSLGMTPTRPRAGRRLSVPLGVNLHKRAHIPPECRAPPGGERFVSEMPSLRHSFGEADFSKVFPSKRLSAPPKLDIGGAKGMFGTLAVPQRRGSFGGATGQRKFYPGRRMSGPPNMQNLVDPGVYEFDPRGPDEGGPFGIPRTRPDRRGSFGGATGQRRVCPGRRLSAPPETIAALDSFGMEPRRPVTRPRHSLGMTPTRPRAGRRLSGPPAFNLQRGARVPPECRAPPASESFTSRMPSRRHSFGETDFPNQPPPKRLSAPPGLTYGLENDLERSSKVSFIDITKPDGEEQHISILSEATRSPKEVHFSTSRDSPDRSLIEDVSFSFEDIEGLDSSGEMNEDIVLVDGPDNTPWKIAIKFNPKSPKSPSSPLSPRESQEVKELKDIICGITSTPKMKRRKACIPRSIPKMSPIIEINERMYPFTPSPTPSPHRYGSANNTSEFERLEEMCRMLEDVPRSPTPPRPSAQRKLNISRSPSRIPSPNARTNQSDPCSPSPAPSPQRPHPSEMTALERMLEGIDDDAFGTTSTPGQVYASFFAKPAPTPSQVYASFLAKPSPAPPVCQPGPSGLRPPMARSPTAPRQGIPGPSVVRRTEVLRTPTRSGMRAPAPICIPTPAPTYIRTPEAASMRTPASTGMRTPVASGMRTPAATGMRTPSASGMRAPAGSGMRTPSQTSVRTISATVIRTPAVASQRSSAASGLRTPAGGTRVSVITQRISSVTNASPTPTASSSLRPPSAGAQRPSASGLRAPTRSTSNTAIPPPTGCASRLRKPTKK